MFLNVWRHLVSWRTRKQSITTPSEISEAAPPFPLEKLDLKNPQSFLVALKHYPHAPSVRAGIGRFVKNNLHEKLDGYIEDLLCKFALPEVIRIETVSLGDADYQNDKMNFADNDDTHLNVMKMTTFDILIKQLQLLPTIRSARLSLDGEPLLNKNHALMCKRMKLETAIPKIKFVTNGMLFNQSWCNQIAQTNIHSIWVSIDGCSPEEHNKLQLGTDYEIIKNNISMLKNALIEAGSSTQLQIINTQIQPATVTSDNEKTSIPYFLKTDFPEYNISSNYKRDDFYNVKNTNKYKTCDHPFSDLVIRKNGDITFCSNAVSEKMGNIHHDTVLDIYQSPDYISMRLAMLHKDIKGVPDICKRCKNFND